MFPNSILNFHSNYFGVKPSSLSFFVGGPLNGPIWNLFTENSKNKIIYSIVQCIIITWLYYINRSYLIFLKGLIQYDLMWTYNLLYFIIIFASFFSSGLTMILIDNICSIVPHHFILYYITFYITLVDQCARTKLYIYINILQRRKYNV